jgi:hypothetical protein
VPAGNVDGQLVLDTEAIAAAVRHKHGVNLTPDDPAFLLVTINQLVLEGVLEEFDCRISQIIGQAHQEMDEMRTHAAAELGKSVRTSALAIRRELQADIEAAKLEAQKLVIDIKQAYSQANNRRWVSVGVVTGFLSVVLGILIGYSVHRWGL